MWFKFNFITEFAIDIATQVMKRTNELYEKALQVVGNIKNNEPEHPFLRKHPRHITEVLPSVYK